MSKGTRKGSGKMEGTVSAYCTSKDTWIWSPHLHKILGEVAQIYNHGTEEAQTWCLLSGQPSLVNPRSQWVPYLKIPRWVAPEDVIQGWPLFSTRMCVDSHTLPPIHTTPNLSPSLFPLRRAPLHDRPVYPSRKEREALILSSYAGVLMVRERALHAYTLCVF